MGIIKIPDPELSESEIKARQKLNEKLEEYKNHFDDDFTTENLGMSIAEIIANIDKCINSNRKWEGFIVPEVDEDDLI